MRLNIKAVSQLCENQLARLETIRYKKNRQNRQYANHIPFWMFRGLSPTNESDNYSTTWPCYGNKTGICKKKNRYRKNHFSQLDILKRQGPVPFAKSGQTDKKSMSLTIHPSYFKVTIYVKFHSFS